MENEQAKKILDALETIREECFSHAGCLGCPMKSIASESCMLKNSSPDKWVLNYTLPDTWRAFK